MINSLTIQNYSSWKDAVLEFSHGLNVITGETDSGKSALIGAMNWVINNRPSGEEYRTWGTEKEKTAVCLELAEKILVGRLRSRSENIYAIAKIPSSLEKLFSEKDNKLESFGQDVPREVKELLNFDDLNIQYQMDQPFLFTESPGEVARYINKLVDLDVISSSLSNIARVEKKARTDLEYAENHLTSLQEELTQFNDLESAEKKLLYIEQLSGQAGNIRHAIPELSKIIYDINELEDEIKIRVEVREAEKALDSLIADQDSITKERKRLKELRSLIEEIALLETETEEGEQVAKAGQSIDKLIGLEKELDRLNTDIHYLGQLVKDIERYEIQIKQGEIALGKMEEEIKELMPDRCPILDIPCKELEKRK